MKADWLTLVTMAGIFFGTLVSLHLVTIKRPGFATKWLGLYTLMLTVGLSEPLTENSSLAGFIGGLSFMYGPFIYLYIRHRLLGLEGIGRSDFKHALPFLIYTIAFTFYFFSDVSGMDRDIKDLVEFLAYELLFIHIFWYLIKSYLFIGKNKSMLSQEDLDLTKMRVVFLRILVMLSMVLFAGSFTAAHVFLFTGTGVPFEFKYVVQIALCAMIFVIALLNTETMHAKKLIKSF